MHAVHRTYERRMDAVAQHPPDVRRDRADDVGGLPISYTFTNGVPTSMTLFASRNSDAHLDYDLAMFVQDQWALRRLTLQSPCASP